MSPDSTSPDVQPRVPVPASAIFPTFSACNTLADHILVGSRHSVVSAMDIAIAAAKINHDQGGSPDPSLIASHAMAVSTTGPIALFQQLSELLRPASIQPTFVKLPPVPHSATPILDPEVHRTLFNQHSCDIHSASPINKDGVTHPCDNNSTCLMRDGVANSCDNNSTCLMRDGVANSCDTNSDTSISAVAPLALTPAASCQSFLIPTPSQLPPTPVPPPTTPRLASHPSLDAFCPPDGPRLLQHETINYIADHGGPIFTMNDFVPNMGAGLRQLPPHIAHPDVLKAHFGKAQQKGNGVILSLATAIATFQSFQVDLHISNAFLRYKDANSPLMRLISDYSNCAGDSINNPLKKDLLANIFSGFNTMSAADLCQLIANARSVFPEEEIYITRVDVSGAFPRIRVRPEDVPLLGLLFIIDDVQHVYFPLVAQFGCQDSNYQWELIGHYLQHQSLLRSHAYSPYSTLSFGYVDDFCSAGSQSYTQIEIASITEDCKRVGAHAVNVIKNIWSTRAEILGYVVDTVQDTIGISGTMLEKLLNKFFVELPHHVQVGDPTPVTFLQSLASYAIRCANVIPSMLNFSRGFSYNTVGHLHHINAPLSSRSVDDIHRWRQFLAHAVNDTALLSTTTNRPLLLRRLPHEDDFQRSDRQAASCDYPAFSDACTTNNGLGGFLPGLGWFSADIPHITHFTRVDDTLAPIDVNVLEFIALLLTLISLIIALRDKGKNVSGMHFHLRTDNSSCRSWVNNHRSIHPLHSYILHLFSNVQQHFNVFVTIGPIKGVDNIYADAASRSFHCPNGPALRAFLQDLPRLPVSLPLLNDMARVASLPSMPTYAIVRDARMALALAITTAGAPSTPSLPI